MSLEGSLLQHAELRRAAGGVRGLWMTYGGNQWVHIGGEVVQLHEFGAVGDGVTDDTAAVQAAINAAMGNTLYLPPGRYRITSTLTITGTNSIQIIGANTYPSSLPGYGSGLYWEGNATDPLLRLLGVRDSLFENFGIVASSAFPLAVAIKSETSLAGGVATNCVYRRIWMQGTDGGIGKGWQFCAGDRGDANNDVNTFDNCNIGNFTVAGWSLEHSQSKSHKFYGCGYLAWTTTGTYGLATSLGTFVANQGGSFLWYGGGGGNVEVDFYLGSPNDSMMIQGGNFEGSKRFIKSNEAGFGTSGWPLNIIGNRWAGNGLHADHIMIDTRYSGPINIIGNEFGDATDGEAGVHPIIRLGMAGSGTALITGNYFVGSEANTFNPIQTYGGGACRINMFANTFCGDLDPSVSGASDPTFTGHPAFASWGSFAALAVSPTTLTGDVNDYNPSGAGFWRLASDASRTITGIADGSDGRQLVIINVGEKPIVLANQHASSTTTNRIITGTPANRELLPDEVATLIYDNTTTRWRIVH